VFPLRRALQRPLLAAASAIVMTLVPLTAGASANLVEALWNQPDGVSVDSGWYAVQSWWNGMNGTVPDDPTQRGLDELAQANADLQNVYNLLRGQRANPGPQPVAVVDPLVSSIYNAVTGASISAPIGSFFDWVNQGMLKLEGRGSRADIARQLLQDYRTKQAVGLRDLRRTGGTDTEALLTVNTARERALLAKISAVSHELKGMVAEADQSTTAVAARLKDAGQGKANDGKGKAGSSKGQPANSSSNGQGQPKH